MELPNNIIFYDGDCGFCNKSIRCLIKLDTKDLLYFAPLQGKTAQQILPQIFCEAKNLNTMVYAISENNNWKFFTKSSAALMATRNSSKFSLISKALLLIPSFIRDAVYDLIAYNRHHIQVSNSCEPLPEKYAARILP